MMKNLLLLSGALFLASTSFAGVVNFDDVTTTNYIQIANGYHGFNWNNFYIQNSTALPQSGYAAGAVSGTNVAFNGFGPATISSATPFTFSSVYMTAAWDDGVSVLVQGIENGVVVDSTTVNLSATNPTLFTFSNWSGLTSLEFTASGGTQHPGYASYGDEVAFDNLSITANPSALNAAPEPGETVLLVAGLAGLAAFARRRFTAAARA